MGDSRLFLSSKCRTYPKQFFNNYNWLALFEIIFELNLPFKLDGMGSKLIIRDSYCKKIEDICVMLFGVLRAGLEG